MIQESENIKVLVIDDSSYNRKRIAAILSSVESITVCGQAADGNEGLKLLHECEPDIITLDLEMPNMDGYTFLRILMTRRPTPVIVISSHSGRENVFKALELGALDFIAKPSRSVAPDLRTIENELITKVLNVVKIRPVRLRAHSTDVSTGEHPVANYVSSASRSAPLGVVCIAASTGGPPALKRLFEGVSGDLPVAILVSQHMPPTFTAKFASRLNDASQFEVREARSGDRLQAGLALVAPGDRSILIEGAPGSGDYAVLLEGLEDSGEKIVPSGDRMMEAAAANVGSAVMGIVLTGMGNDGARGMREINHAGGFTVAESENSAVIFGMPEASIRSGIVNEVLPIEAMPGAIARFASNLKEKVRKT